jgi:oxygen-independent coproporphyrinogen-3 oxidase
MCDMAVDFTAVAKRSRIDTEDIFSDALPLLKPLRENGALLIEGRRIEITEKGRPFVRIVASAFDTYLTGSRARHSPAV